MVEAAGADCRDCCGSSTTRGVWSRARRLSRCAAGRTDGNRFIDAAVAQGAVAIVTDSQRGVCGGCGGSIPGIAVARVEHGRRALAELSAAVLGHPERKLKVSAVTGTNGKTTTAYLLEQMLRSVGRKCVLIGTIETHIGDEVRASRRIRRRRLRDLLKIFADGVAAGATEVVMEMSFACAGAGAGVGDSGGCGDLYESDAGPSGLSRDDGKVLRSEGAVV